MTRVTRPQDQQANVRRPDYILDRGLAMNRRSLLRAIGLTAAVAATADRLRPASAQPAPPRYRPPGPPPGPGRPPHLDRPGFAAMPPRAA